MTSILNVPAANQLLVELPEVERNAFMAACDTVELSFGEVLLQPTETFTHVYFPIDSFILLTNDWKSRWRVGKECWAAP